MVNASIYKLKEVVALIMTFVQTKMKRSLCTTELLEYTSATIYAQKIDLAILFENILPFSIVIFA